MEQAKPPSMELAKLWTIPIQPQTTMNNMSMYIGRTPQMKTITKTSQTPTIKRMEQNIPQHMELMEQKRPLGMKHQIAPLWIRWISLTSKTSQT